jgi:phosphotriesterase-related protein
MPLKRCMSIASSLPDQLRYSVLAHEHLAINFFTARDDSDSIFHWTLESLKQASHAGVQEIWDMSNQTLGRDLDVLARLADLAGVSIVASTGHYLDQYHARETRDLTAAELARHWLRELNLAVGTVRVGIVGEIATGRESATESERKALEAAASVQRETGVPIYTHTTYGTLALWQLDVLMSAGASAERVVIGHADVFHPMDALLGVASSGAYLGIDTVGKQTWRGLDGRLYSVSDEHRIEIIRQLVDAQFERQIVLSSDLLYERGEVSLNPTTFGQHGYSYVSELFLPRLITSEIAPSAIQAIARGNALRLRGSS